MKKITFLLIFLATTFGFSQPTTDAPAPPARDAGDVISIYGGGNGGNAYTNISGVNFTPNWGQPAPYTAPNPAFDIGGGNTVLFYTALTYQGVEFSGNAQNASSMEFLHLDVWAEWGGAAPNVAVTPINPGDTPTEILVPFTVQNGAWVSIDIPKSSFTGQTWNNVIQFKFEALGWGSGATRPNLYIDNMYFWRPAVNPLENANLSNLEVNGSIVPGFSPGTITYEFPITSGEAVPQITAANPENANATVVITQAGAVPGSATVEVTAEDGTTTKTYTVNYIIEGPTSAAPVPPARPVNDVISIFSDAYQDISVDTYDTPWCPNTTTEISINGDAIKKVTGGVCEGIDWQSARTVDATNLTNFHIDVFIPEDTDMDGKVLNMKFSQWGGGGGEVSAVELNLNTGTTPAITTGWNFIDVSFAIPPFSGSLNRNDIVQFVVTSNIQTFYYDNLYLHRNTVLSTDEFSSTDFRVYPNPSNLEWNVEANSTIKSISLVNILGKQVLNLEPNSSNFAIDNTNLATGLYFATIATENGSSVVKLIKN